MLQFLISIVASNIIVTLVDLIGTSRNKKILIFRFTNAFIIFTPIQYKPFYTSKLRLTSYEIMTRIQNHVTEPEYQ